MGKSLGKVLDIDSSGVSVGALLMMLQARMPKSDEPPLSRANTLVAVNGVEVSALNGEDTKLSDGDVIMLIPVSHGG
ncbi:MAG: MoaD/ThiS family protein [Thaumarchaeota archaeon]|nr:MoaD/ThiS family protein [Nitrososphaerota archaeon]